LGDGRIRQPVALTGSLPAAWMPSADLQDPLHEEAAMAVSIPLHKSLDKAYEDASLAELLKAPASALSGVSDGDATKLKEAFGIDTIEELGRHKAIRLAVTIVDLADAAQ
jgi:hypothetical protein